MKELIELARASRGKVTDLAAVDILIQDLADALEQSEERVKQARIDALNDAIEIAGEYDGSTEGDDNAASVSRDISILLWKIENDEHPEQDLYYIQDKTSYVGNSVLWWRKGGNGYTCDLEEAMTVTKEEALKMHRNRRTDIPWQKWHVDSQVSKQVDIQSLTGMYSINERSGQ